MEGDTAREAVGDYRYGFHDPESATIRFDKGLSESVVRDISELKNEPEWMTEMRVKAYNRFMEMPMPRWGNSDVLDGIDFDSITYFLRSSEKTEKLKNFKNMISLIVIKVGFTLIIVVLLSSSVNYEFDREKSWIYTYNCCTTFIL